MTKKLIVGIHKYPFHPYVGFRVMEQHLMFVKNSILLYVGTVVNDRVQKSSENLGGKISSCFFPACLFIL